jgi:hypothetical protein
MCRNLYISSDSKLDLLSKIFKHMLCLLLIIRGDFMNKRGNIWLWVLLVIIVIVGCIILYYDGSNDVGLPDNSDEVVNLDSGIFDCGSNVDCLYSAMSSVIWRVQHMINLSICLAC